MARRPAQSLANHRARRAREGFVRVELTVRKEDASLVRGVAAALTDRARQAETRALLRQRFTQPNRPNLKVLLAAAPLDGITLDRDADTGRDVDL